MRRKGLTLVEVVVLLLLAVIVIGLLLPLMQRTHRGQSNWSQTNNNLKQCALAVHTYHDNFNKLPPGYSTGGQFTKDTSFWIHLLPFVEQWTLYNTLSNQAVPNGLVFTGAVVHPYRAPGDQYATSSAGVVNFAANVRIFGRKTLQANNQPVDEPGSAVEIPEGAMLSGMKLQGIEDGTMNVIMLSTRYADCGGQQTWFAVGPHGQSNFGDPPSPGKGGFMGAGSSTTPASKAGAITDTYQLAPSDRECRPDAGLFGHSFGVGGMSVALCDSSVRNISPTMSPLTFSRAICPCDKQKLDADWAADD